MTVRVGFQKSGDTAEDHRLALQTLLASTGALTARGGTVAGLDLVKVGGMQNKVTPGQAWVPGTAGALQGAYPVTVDADVTFTHVDGDATRDRIDLVVLEVLDTTYDGSGQQIGRVRAVQGAYPGAGSPVAPAVPASAIALFEQRVNAGTSAGSGGVDTALVTDRRQSLFPDVLSEATTNLLAAGMAAGWGLTGGQDNRFTIFDNRDCDLVLNATNTGGTLFGSRGGSHNISDTTVATLPAAARPRSPYYGIFSVGGVASGSYSISTTGVVSIQTLDDEASIVNGGSLHFTARYACQGA